MVDTIDPFTTPTPNDPNAIGTAEADVATPETDQNLPPETPAQPEEETDEEWARRFVEENAHLAPPPLVRPPAPPPQPWDAPRSQWKVPDHLSMPHPNGGYMAMALLSRTMDDLDEVTGGTRAATYEEVDKYFGHALIAEGLVPFTYTADEAIRWWKAGGYRVLANDAVSPGASEQDPLEQEHLGALWSSASGLMKPVAFGSGGGSATAGGSEFADSGSLGLARSTDTVYSPISWQNASAESDSSFAGLTARLTPDGRAKKSAGTTRPIRTDLGSAAEMDPKAPPPKYGYRADPRTQLERLLALTGKVTLEIKRSNGTASNDPYSGDNLYLGVNDEYRHAILQAARKFGLPPQTLAALIGAEASKNRQHEWNPKSRNIQTHASGLTQFTADTWLGEAARRGSYLNSLARELGYLNEKGRIAPQHKEAFLDLRFNTDHSINASADYAASNLASLKKRGLVSDESPAALARYAYLAHHEGLQGATDFLQGNPLSVLHWNQNVPARDRKYWLAHNGPDISTAYRAFMEKYTDDLIDVTDYMYDPGKITPPPTSSLRGQPK